MKTPQVHRNNTCEPPRRAARTSLILLILVLFAGTARAAFHGDLLDGRDATVLRPPTTIFAEELRRLPSPVVGSSPVPATNSVERQSIEAEIADLRTALRLAGSRDAEEIVRAHREEREAAAAKFDGLREMIAGLDTPDSEAQRTERTIRVVDGLPKEFAEYFRGWVAFKEGRTNDAVRAFEAVLALPEKERRHKSVWAAYMLGRAQQDETPDKAVASFQLARALAKQGFGDPLGLAAESVGWEARAHVHEKRFVRALELYRQQFAAGDSGALVSLKWTAEAAVEEGGQPLADVAAHPVARRVVTAMLTSRGYWAEFGEPESDSPESTWLELMEQVGTKDSVLAEQLALLAYQLGNTTRTRLWIERARKAPVAEWMRAKMLLRDGKLDEGGRLLAALAPTFPRNRRCEEEAAPSRMADCLEAGWDAAGLRIEAELAVVRLCQNRHAEALELFLRSGSEIDAAYVAERVLTLDELKAQVDRSWPPSFVSADDVAELDESAPCSEHQRRADLRRTEERRKTIRSLLARRLIRASRGAEARPYVDAEMAEVFERMLAGLQRGEDESLPKIERAKGWWDAAQIIRTNGLELVATEVEPDWAASGGNDEPVPTLSNRMASEELKVFAASRAEIRRAEQNAADPVVRFHYRYQAAFIAMDAAKLLPDNDDLTATILFTAGSWLKVREPKVADIFYKALVKRCGKTELGRAADAKRWFPLLDADGRPISKRTPRWPVDELPEGIVPVEPLPLDLIVVPEDGTTPP